MEPLINDPYLKTVKRSLKDKKLQVQKRNKIEKRNKTDNFFKKKFEITDYINLPEGVANILFFIAFLVIPYIVGITFIFIVIAKASIETFSNMNINEYSISWAIGYELIASLLLFIIIKSAISFRRVE